jgi:hypothetical protein
MSEMVDKIARALCIQAGEIPDLPTPYNPNADFVWQFYRGSARAAIEAMRAPHSEMIEAGLNCDAWANAEGNAVEMLSATFSAMIDAALKE